MGQKDQRYELSMRSRREGGGKKLHEGEKQHGRWSEIAVKGDRGRD